MKMKLLWFVFLNLGYVGVRKIYIIAIIGEKSVQFVFKSVAVVHCEGAGR